MRSNFFWLCADGRIPLAFHDIILKELNFLQENLEMSGRGGRDGKEEGGRGKMEESGRGEEEEWEAAGKAKSYWPDWSR